MVRVGWWVLGLWMSYGCLEQPSGEAEQSSPTVTQVGEKQIAVAELSVSQSEDCHELTFPGSNVATGLLACGAPDTIRPDLVLDTAAACEAQGAGQLIVGPVCRDDSDCEVGSSCDVATGWCELVPQCESNGDCEANEICLCAAVRGMSASVPYNACVPANCGSSEDCGAYECGVSAGGGCGQVDGAYCHTPHDECQRKEDCQQDDGVFRQCLYALTAGRWQCQEAVFGCGS